MSNECEGAPTFGPGGLGEKVMNFMGFSPRSGKGAEASEMRSTGGLFTRQSSGTSATSATSKTSAFTARSATVRTPAASRDRSQSCAPATGACGEPARARSSAAGRLEKHGLASDQQDLIGSRLTQLSERIEHEAKTSGGA